jgi:hypothetical protein
MLVDGDTDFLMQICQGQPRYAYFEAHLSKVNNEKYRSFEIPDGTEPPAEESDARVLAGKFVMPLKRIKFEFSEYPGFGSIGPLIMDRLPEVAHGYLSHEAKARGHKGFEAEWAMLERYYKDLKGAPSAWELYLDEWRDDLPLGDHIVIETSAEYSRSGKANHSLLVQMGHELWASFENFEDYDSLPGMVIVPISCETFPDEAAAQIAFWINENGGSIAAALSLDPEFDYTGSEDGDVDELFEDYHEENVCTIDCATVDLDLILRELRKLSRDFALTEMLLDPEQFGTDAHGDALSAMESRITNLRKRP